MSTSDISSLGVRDVQQGILQKKFTSSQLVDAYLQTAKAKSHLNAFITLNETNAREQAEHADEQLASGSVLGPLHGVPLVVKDNIHVAGLPNTAGCKGLANFVPNENNVIVDRLLKAGAIVLGKVNMHELAFGTTSTNYAYGFCRNPHNDKMFPGGSSGGTACAVAAAMAPGGLGSDTRGSTRIPASLCGVASNRPTSGRYSNARVTPISTTHDTIGFMCRKVTDVVLLDGVVTESETTGASPVEPRDPNSIKLGLPRKFFWEDLDPETDRVCNEVVRKLQAAGVTVKDVDVRSWVEVAEKEIGFTIFAYECMNRDLHEYLKHFNTGITFEQLKASIESPDVKAVFDEGSDPNTEWSREKYEAALDRRKEMMQEYEDCLQQHGVEAFILPTTPAPARPSDTSVQTVELNGRQVSTIATFARQAGLAAIPGNPSMNIPCGMTNDQLPLPIGIQIDGRKNEDNNLMGIALAIEKIVKQD